jgi:predicted NBD/HSP70 family sugar kinase
VSEHTEPAEGRGRHDGLLLTLLRDRGNLSRTDLASAARLSPATITKAVGSLLDRGLVREQEVVSSAGIGRPAVGLVPVVNAVRVCGVLLGSGVVELGVVNAAGETQHTWTLEFDVAEPAEAVLDRIADEIAALPEDAAGAALIGIGVGVPGPVDPHRRRNLLSVNLGWRDVPIADHLERRLGIRTVVDQSVRAMAIGELRHGDCRPDGNLAFVYVGTGVGLGVVLRGVPFYGGTHGLTALGHLKVVDNGRLCGCGARGCLETEVSVPRLRQRLAEVTGDAVRIDCQAAEGGLLRVLERSAAEGHPAGIQLREDIVRHLSTGLVSVVNLFNPGLIRLGGVFSNAPESLFDSLHQRLVTEVFTVLRDDLRIERPVNGFDAGTVGCATLALEALHYRTIAMTH